VSLNECLTNNRSDTITSNKEIVVEIFLFLRDNISNQNSLLFIINIHTFSLVHSVVVLISGMSISHISGKRSNDEVSINDVSFWRCASFITADTLDLAAVRSIEFGGDCSLSDIDI